MIDREEAVKLYKENQVVGICDEVCFEEQGVEYRLKPDRRIDGVVFVGAFVNGVLAGTCVTHVPTLHNALRVETRFRRKRIGNVLDAVKNSIDGRNPYELVDNFLSFKFYFDQGYIPCSFLDVEGLYLEEDKVNVIKNFEEDHALKRFDILNFREILQGGEILRKSEYDMKQRYVRLKYSPEEKNDSWGQLTDEESSELFALKNPTFSKRIQSFFLNYFKDF